MSKHNHKPIPPSAPPSGGSLRAAASRGVKQQQLNNPTPSPPPAPKKDKKTKPPQSKRPGQKEPPVLPPGLKVAKDAVAYKCGHYYTAQAISEMQCHACRQKHINRKRIEKTIIDRKRGTYPILPPDFPIVKRLPPGSIKTATWDGTNWNGALTVPGCPETFVISVDTEKKCFLGLHRLYVLWIYREVPRGQWRPKDRKPPEGTETPKEEQNGTEGRPAEGGSQEGAAATDSGPVAEGAALPPPDGAG